VGSDSTIESIQFANGSIWNFAKIETEIAKNISLTQIGTNTNDTLQGDNASTTFIGNQGNDKLNGGAGVDSFVFNAKLKANVDKIKDFASVWDDKRAEMLAGIAALADAAKASGEQYEQLDNDLAQALLGQR